MRTNIIITMNERRFPSPSEDYLIEPNSQ